LLAYLLTHQAEFTRITACVTADVLGKSVDFSLPHFQNRTANGVDVET